MKSLNSFLELILVILLLLVITSGLVNTEYFFSNTSIAYYGFCITTFLYVIILNFNTNKKEVISLKPILLFGLWCLYVSVHYFFGTGTLVFTIYSIALFFLLIKATSLFSIPNFKFKQFFIGIAVIATIESMYCIGQFFGILKSQSKLFNVTGSWSNPNVTAIFLALTVPVFLYLFQGKFKKIIFTGFLSLLIALVLLKCRAAFIGTILSIIVFYSLEYRFINWIKNKNNRTSAKALLILSVLIIVPLSSQLYNAKKASADGRKFIWKLSTLMATDRPVTGYGYGSFEKEYNLYQVKYIKDGKATTEELANAGPVIMPHNELLYNLVEGGIIGLVLIVSFFGSLLFSIKQRKNIDTNHPNLKIEKSHFHLAYAGIIAFIGMSMVNSTIQIVPVMCIMIIYAAIICSQLKPLPPSENFTFLQNNRTFSIIYKITILSISFYLLYLLYGMAAADRQNKKAKILKETGYYEQALIVMPDLESHLREDTNYWKNYGNIYFELHKYQAALNCFKKAQTLSTLPEIYGGTGICYEKLHQYPQAIQQYETLVALYPSKFSYRMMLLKIYLKNKDTTKAITLAKKIIQLKPKIPSEKVNRYKKMCQMLLKRLGVQK